LPNAPLSRLLLQCRFDFQNKLWNLPAPPAGPADRLTFSSNQAALLPLLNVVSANFSDPSLGGANPSKSVVRRINRRHLRRRALGKTKQPTKDK
jgi:hypothetical protein